MLLTNSPIAPPAPRWCDFASQQLTAALRDNYQSLLTALERRCLNRQEAADLLHDAVCIALEHMSRGRIKQATRTTGYIYRVARNILRNQHRKASRTAQSSLEEVPELQWDQPEDPTQDPTNVQAAGVVRAAIDAMKIPRDRAILVHHYLQERDRAAICLDLHISHAHFDRVLHRARRRLRALLVERGMDPGDLIDLGTESL